MICKNCDGEGKVLNLVRDREDGGLVNVLVQCPVCKGKGIVKK